MSVRPLSPVALLVLAACSRQPKAPPLTGEAVYENDAIGLRFLAPAGWPVQSRATPPSGPLPRPVILVAYEQAGGERPAEFALLAADLPADADLLNFLVTYRVSGDPWTPRPPGTPVTINGVPATRFLLTRMQGKEEYRREVTAFRREGRVYFFLVTFAASDPAARDAVRKSLDSITWTK